MTVQVELLPLPSAALAVMVAVPEERPVTLPEESTEATLLLEEDHLTLRLEALEGRTVTERLRDEPAARDICL